jgi:GNAT superfamily N-acetyltransferase
VIIREATPADAPAVALVHVRAWKVAYRGLFPDDFLDALRPEDREGRYTLGSSDPADPRTIVAVEEDRVIGFATISLSRDEDLPEAGELCALYIDPSHWHRGVGRGLLAESLRHLREAGHREALLWVLTGNEPAERLYRAEGWQPDGAVREEDPWGVTARVVRFRRSLVVDEDREV